MVGLMMFPPFLIANRWAGELIAGGMIHCRINPWGVVRKPSTFQGGSLNESFVDGE
jgi:hypothetical protein